MTRLNSFFSFKSGRSFLGSGISKIPFLSIIFMAVEYFMPLLLGIYCKYE